MRSSLSTLAGSTRRRAVLIGAGALTIVAVGAGTTAAFAATSTPSASASASTSSQYPSLRAIFRELPSSLKTDLKTLKGDSDSAKAAERKTIEGKALSGAYGPEIARVAHVFAGKDGAKTTSVIPASLKADLKTLRGDAKGSAARTAEVTTIWQKALGGSYGTTIETAAKAAVSHYQAHHKG